MIWQIGHLSGLLALTALLAGYAGWCWHLYRSARRSEERAAERSYLFSKLLRRAKSVRNDLQPVFNPDAEDARGLDAASAAAQAQRVADLERRLHAALIEAAEVETMRADMAELRSALNAREGAFEEAEELRIRMAELARKLAEAQNALAAAQQDKPNLAAELEFDRQRAAEVEDLRTLLATAHTQIQELSGAAEAGRHPTELEAQAQRLAWRALYFERRAYHLEQAIQNAAPVQGPDEAEMLLLRWRNRYLAARTAYLEDQHGKLRLAGQGPAPPDPQETEAALQRASRLRYLDQRLGWVIERSRAAVGAADEEIDALRAELAAARAGLERESARGAEIASARDSAEAQLAQLGAALAQARTAQETLAQARDAALAEAAGAMHAAEAAQAQAQAAADEAAAQARLRWKARYLEARVAQLEERLSQPAPPLAVTPAVAPPPVALAPAPSPALPVAPAPEAPAPARPPRLPAPRNGAPDDLRLIHGVSPQVESKLHASGIYHFDQIAAWSAAEAAWVDRYLALRGQIEREGWIAQAADLCRDRLPAE